MNASSAAATGGRASGQATSSPKEGSLSPSQAAASTLHALSRSKAPSTPTQGASGAPAQSHTGAASRPASASLYSSSQPRSQQPAPFNVRTNAAPLLSQSLYSNVGPSGAAASSSSPASSSSSSATSRNGPGNNGQRIQRAASGSPGGPGSPLKREMDASVGRDAGAASAGHGNARPPSNGGKAATNASSSKSGGGGKEGSGGKRKKANRACFHCQKAHLTCDDSRPCQRCVKKGLADTCTDGFRKKAKYLLDDEELEELKRQKEAKAAERKRLKQQASASAASAAAANAAAASTAAVAGSSAAPETATPAPSAMEQALSSATAAPANPGTSPANEHVSSQLDSGQSVASHQSEPTFELAFDPTHNFGSEATSLEYSILSSMLNGTDLALLGSGTDSPDFQTSPAMGVLDNLGDYATGTGANGWNVSGSGGFDSILGVSTAPGNLDGLTAYADPTGLTSTSPDFGSGGAVLSELPAGDAGFTALEDPSPAPSKPAFDAGGAAASSRLSGGGDGYEADQSTAQPSGSLGANSNLGSGGSGESADTGAAMAGAEVGTMYPSSDAYSANRSASNEPLPDINKAIAQRRNQRLQQDSLWKARVAKVYRDSTQPFPYPEGYHFLIKYATENFGKQDVLRIVRALAIFRPSLIALQMPLTEEDEIFVERSFQRTILEFEKLISFSGTPTVVWRRTCEICVVGAEFCMLTQWSREELLGRYIYEFMDKNSTLDYWEKFALHAFENTSQSVMTTCTLMTPQGKPVPCAWSFTIKRDIFDLPSLVVGNFLPVLS